MKFKIYLSPLHDRKWLDAALASDYPRELHDLLAGVVDSIAVSVEEHGAIAKWAATLPDWSTRRDERMGHSHKPLVFEMVT